MGQLRVQVLPEHSLDLGSEITGKSLQSYDGSLSQVWTPAESYLGVGAGGRKRACLWP